MYINENWYMKIMWNSISNKQANWGDPQVPGRLPVQELERLDGAMSWFGRQLSTQQH